MRLPPLRRCQPLLALALLLGGCSGTRFGDALSGSFPDPAAALSPAPVSPASANPTNAKPASANPAGAKPEAAKSPSAKPAAADPTPPAPAPAAPRAKPPAAVRRADAPAVPYRVTLRLPLADPAAPAEGVTEALRAAGVPFEVETIERLGGTIASPTAPPAPVTVRPAPAPQPLSPR